MRSIRKNVGIHKVNSFTLHKPRKDMCVLITFLNSKQEELQHDFEEHVLRKDETFNSATKESAGRGKCVLIESDLEAVCYTPTNAKALFYKSRLAV